MRNPLHSEAKRISIDHLARVTCSLLECWLFEAETTIVNDPVFIRIVNQTRKSNCSPFLSFLLGQIKKAIDSFKELLKTLFSLYQSVKAASRLDLGNYHRTLEKRVSHLISKVNVIGHKLGVFIARARELGIKPEDTVSGTGIAILMEVTPVEFVDALCSP